MQFRIFSPKKECVKITVRARSSEYAAPTEPISLGVVAPTAPGKSAPVPRDIGLVLHEMTAVTFPLSVIMLLNLRCFVC